MRLLKRLFIISAVVSIAVLLCSAVSQAVDENLGAEKPTLPEEVLPQANEPDVLWLWGDVVSADAQKGELLVKYLDYETDNEKNVAILVDDKTTFENVKTLSEIKPLDTVSVDYIVNANGTNTAKNISVEKPEMLEGPEIQQSTEERAPSNNTKEAPVAQP